MLMYGLLPPTATVVITYAHYGFKEVVVCLLQLGRLAENEDGTQALKGRRKVWKSERGIICPKWYWGRVNWNPRVCVGWHDPPGPPGPTALWVLLPGGQAWCQAIPIGHTKRWLGGGGIPLQSLVIQSVCPVSKEETNKFYTRSCSLNSPSTVEGYLSS